MRWMKRAEAAFGRKSIRQKNQFGFFVMMAGLAVVMLVALLVVRMTTDTYRSLSGRVADAERIYAIAQEQVGTSAYYLVAGRTSVETSALPEELTEISSTVMRLAGEVSGERGTQLKIIQRTMGTLKRYAGRLVEQVEANEPVEAQNDTLDQIRDVSALTAEQITRYIYLELDYMARQEQALRTWTYTLMAVSAAIIAGVLLVMILVQYAIDRSISVPINALAENLRRLSEGDFSARSKNQGANEIDVLSDSFNRMVRKLEVLMEQLQENTRTREQLELRLLQEQINPHFLYNTLELIVWLAESGDKETVIHVVQSLSNFFRVVLSQGRAVVSVAEELACIKSYLYIQQIRYSDILRYEVDADEDTLNLSILKLTLQPLVENALYHGIKTRRGGGVIRVSVCREGEGLRLTVADNGSGMEPEQLERLRTAVSGGKTNATGFGLMNVQKRVQLEYGAAYGLEIDSAPGQGTTVTLHLPARPYGA